MQKVTEQVDITIKPFSALATSIRRSRRAVNNRSGEYHDIYDDDAYDMPPHRPCDSAYDSEDQTHELERTRKMSEHMAWANTTPHEELIKFASWGDNEDKYVCAAKRKLASLGIYTRLPMPNYTNPPKSLMDSRSPSKGRSRRRPGSGQGRGGRRRNSPPYQHPSKSSCSHFMLQRGAQLLISSDVRWLFTPSSTETEA